MAAMDKEKINDLKTNVVLARKRSLSFGLCLGKTPENTVLLCHKTKDPKLLGRLAKKEGETAKNTYGTMACKGKVLELSCQGDELSGLARKFKKTLIAAGLQMKVLILDAAGNPLEDDGEPEEDAPEAGNRVGGGGAAAPAEAEKAQGADAGDTAEPDDDDQRAATGVATDPMAEKWAAGEPRVAAVVEEFLQGGDKDAGEIQDLWAKAKEAGNNGDPAGALKLAAKVVALITTAREARKTTDKDGEKWIEVSNRLRPHVEQALESGLPVAKKIRAVWTFALDKAAGDKPDFGAALKAVAMLVKLIKEVDQAKPAPAMAGADTGADTGTDTGADAQAADPEPAVGGAGGAGGGAQGGAGAGVAPPPAQPPADAQAPAAGDDPAPAAAGPQDAAADPAPAVAPPAAKADLSGDDAAKLVRADAELKAVGKLVTAYMAVMPGSAEPKPPAWLTEIAGLTTFVTTMQAAGAVLETAKLEKALKDLTKLVNTINAKTAEKKNWKKALDLFNIRLLTLDHHAQSTEAEILPKVTDIKAKLAAAETKANGQDFKTAIKALGPLTTRCDEVGLLADGCAHYKAVLASRQALVASTAGNPAVGVASIDGMQAKVADLLAKAAVDAAADKFDDAVKKLDEIPPLHTRMRVLVEKKGDYDFHVTQIDPVFVTIAALPAPQLALLEPGLAAFKKAYADAKVAVTNDYNKSANLMMLLRMKEVPYFDATSQAIGAYFPAKTAFETQFNLFKAHAGRPAIEAFYLAMEADYKSAEDEAKVNRFAAATGLLNRSKGDWAKEQKRAEDHVAYTAKLTALKPMMDGLRPRTGAANALAQADALIATAAKQALARDYGGALANIVEAEKRAAEAKAAADAADALGALKDDTALGKIATDFAAAFKVFTDMRANVAGRDGTGAFAAEIAKADTPAAAAQAASAKAPPDFADARTQLDAAIAILEATLPKIMAFGPWQTHHAAAKALVDTTLPGVNTDNCILAQITEAKALVTAAEGLAAAPGLDIAGAESKLTQVRAITDAAASDAATYTKVASDVVDIKSQKTLLALPVNSAVAALMPKRVARIDKYLTDIPADITAKKMKDAATKAAAGAALKAATAWDVVTGIEALRRKTAWYDVNLASVAGKAPCATLIASAATKLVVYTNDLAVPNFDAAQESIRPANWDLMAAKTVLAASVAFEPKRAAAAAEIAKVNAVRNASVETEIAALEARYTAALALGPAGNYHRATIEMDEITAACPDLVTKATDFQPYEDARVIAREKLDKVLAHAQAGSIQPMLLRLTAKYTAAEKLASQSDFVAAKTMMSEIASDADTALESAENCAAFEMVTDALDVAAGTGILPSAVILATQKVLDQLKARPEAAAATADLDMAATQLATAGAGGGGAKAALQAAIAACEKADETMSQYRMLEQSVVRAKDRVTKLKAHAQVTYIASELAPVEKAVNGALASAVASGNHMAEAATLDGHFTRLQELEALADDYVKYLALRAEPGVEPQVEVLEKHDHRYAIKASLDTMRSKLSQAADKVAEHLVEEALKLLEEVRTLGANALIMANMRDNVAPSPDDIKAILARPGGDGELDAMIDKLEPDAQRKVLQVAFEARFGCKLQDFLEVPPGSAPGTLPVAINPNEASPNIKRFYELMSDLPASDTLGNDSMLLFSDKKAGGSRYNGGDKEVFMNEGQDEFSGAYGFGRDFEVGGEDEDCKPTDMEPVTRFSWNTLHEVGHAVDDKHGYMDKNGSSASHGGWTVHGKDYGPVAQVFAKKYEYDQTYVEQVMLHNPSPAVPEIPAGEACTPEEWESRRIAVENHVKLSHAKSRPWNSNSQAAQIAIKGRVYQESYPNTWISYVLDARKKGMTGYQFRAPGEWFSELYAAYHIGKMKPSHPAVSWLEKL